MAATLQKRVPSAVTSANPQLRRLNAETVTAIATSFLKRVGHKSGLKPKRVSIEEGVYTVEVELKKLMAIVRVDAETQEIKEYEVQSKGEEAALSAFSPKMLIITFCIVAVAYVVLHFVFKMVGL